MDFARDKLYSRETDFFDSMQIPGWKQALDMALIFLALPLVLPLMLFVALLIRVVSSGPILFKQERVGYRGNRFMCYKFRTMRVNADAAAHQEHLNRLMGSNVPMVKMDAQGDPRIMPFGPLLRSSGLDELPQLINVLRGEMSLVGPRPCLPYEYDRYLPWQKERFNTLPGLTGLWQVNGKNRTTFVEMIQLDIHYVRNKTFWLDLKIILKTVPALIRQMWGIRKKQKSLSRPVPAETAAPALAAGPYCKPSTIFVTPAQTDGYALTQKETWSKHKVGG